MTPYHMDSALLNVIQRDFISRIFFERLFTRDGFVSFGI